MSWCLWRLYNYVARVVVTNLRQDACALCNVTVKTSSYIGLLYITQYKSFYFWRSSRTDQFFFFCTSVVCVLYFCFCIYTNWHALWKVDEKSEVRCTFSILWAPLTRLTVNREKVHFAIVRKRKVEGKKNLLRCCYHVVQCGQCNSPCSKSVNDE